MGELEAERERRVAAEARADAYAQAREAAQRELHAARPEEQAPLPRFTRSGRRSRRGLRGNWLK
ncbi:MAG TPA: hypothetical protein VFR41_01470 [Acidimicrobiia bacterium]|nr:hypothetical protein [Acidimicrobiia bacterium]